jgi:hypothetical protein
MGQIKYLISLAFIMIFTLAVVNYGVGFAIDNDAAVSITNESQFDGFSERISNVSKNTRTEINSSAFGFANAELDAQDFAFRTGSTLKQSGRNSSIIATIQTLGVIEETLLGGKEGGFGVIVNLIVGMLILVGFLYVYKTWIGRNPD